MLDKHGAETLPFGSSCPSARTSATLLGSLNSIEVVGGPFGPRKHAGASELKRSGARSLRGQQRREILKLGSFLDFSMSGKWGSWVPIESSASPELPRS